MEPKGCDMSEMGGKAAGQRLVGANEVEGTAVLDSHGSKIGTVQTLMLDKRSGLVAYAVVSFGGFLGLGERHFALPWPSIAYSREEDAYVLDIDERRLADAPSWSTGEMVDWQDEAWCRRVYVYWRQDYAH